RAVLGQNASVGRKAVVGDDAEVRPLTSIEGGGM
ncbi:MAG: hypothetical protein QOI57_1588, partial [Rubrobacteraceae bacterium]|nr:hypothetical protein [Rubrobacteraceae bacterium]